jgi:hypothetical protein
MLSFLSANGCKPHEIRRHIAEQLTNLSEGKIMTIEQIKAEYLRGECDSIHAIEMLQHHCGMSPREAEALVYSWDAVAPYE